jgi:FAD/FMN-containing dehydrogenase
MPAAVAHPGDVEDVAALVSWAETEGAYLVPRGGGTGMPGGNVGAGVIVDFRGWNELAPVDPDARMVRVQPGVLGARLDAAAGAAGFFLPALPSSADRCTVGGMVANNAAGARSFRYGSVRDWVEALDVVLADGTCTTLRRGQTPPARFRLLHRVLLGKLGSPPEGWPHIRKNSSGYALDRFLPSADPLSLVVGSEGTLAVVTGIELRLAPKPAEQALVLLPLPELDALLAVVAAAEAERASACEFFGSSFLDVAGLRRHADLRTLAADAEALALVELTGSRSRVEAGLEGLRALAGSLGIRVQEAREGEERERLWSIRHAASPIVASRALEGLVSMQFIEDSAVPPARLPEYLRSVQEILDLEGTEAVMFGHAGDGNVHVNPLIDVRRRGWRARVRRILEATVDLVADLGGTLSGEHGDGRIRAPFLDRIWGRSLADAFRHTKRSLDPSGILNPGVIVPLPGQDPLGGLAPHREATR